MKTRENLIGLKEAANRLGLSYEHLRQLVRDGKIPGIYRPGGPRGRYQVDPARLEDYKRSTEVRGAA